MRTKQSKANREARAAGKARQARSSALGKLLIMLTVVAAIVFGVAIFFKVNTIEVQGNTVYSADQIVAASQIQQGDNLLTVNKALAAALDVMKELDGTGLLEHIRVIDVEKEYDMTLWYDDRYEIKLGGTDELAYKIRYLCSILDQLSEFQAGTIDLTQAAQKKATFQPAA